MPAVFTGQRRRRVHAWGLACLALGLAMGPGAGAAGAAGAAASPPPKRLTARVARVFDGASFQLEHGLRSSLIGVSAPRPSARGGAQALAFLKQLLEGKTVQLEIDRQLVDPYGQTQYYVFLPDGTFVNALMLLRGYGRALVKFPNVRYRSRLLEAERSAKGFRRGIWGDEFDEPGREEEFPPPFPRRRRYPY